MTRSFRHSVKDPAPSTDLRLPGARSSRDCAPAGRRGALHRALRLTLTSALSLLALPAAQGGDTQTIDSILATAQTQALQTARAAGYANARVRPGRIDPNLRLPACDQALAAFSPPGSRDLGNTTVGVRCEGGQPWTLYVPVRIDATTPALRLVRALAKGSVIGAQDLVVAEAPARPGSTYLTDPDQVIGKQLSRSLPASTLLSDGVLSAQRLVQRGQLVIIRSGQRGLQVQMQGKALADGAQGQRIRVENIRSGRIVEGVVGMDGNVDVTPGAGSAG